VHVARWLELRLGRWDRKSIRGSINTVGLTHITVDCSISDLREYSNYITFFMDASRSGRASNSQPHVFRALCRAVRARARAHVPVYSYLVTFTHREAAEITDPCNRTLASISVSRRKSIQKATVCRVCVCRANCDVSRGDTRTDRSHNIAMPNRHTLR